MAGRLAGLFVLALLVAGPAAAVIPHQPDVTRLYSRDHGGQAPRSEAQLAPYSKAYEKLLGSCKLEPADLTGATTSMAGQVTAAGGRPFSNLEMLRAFTRNVTWTVPRDCWKTFFDVESQAARQVAAAQLQYQHEVGALYVIDHDGKNPPSEVELLPYSKAFVTIMAACKISAEDNTNLMWQLADKASVLGARHVTSLQMLQAVARRIDWKGKRVCWTVYDDAEGHMETGGP
jgi:hypothetical protein